VIREGKHGLYTVRLEKGDVVIELREEYTALSSTVDGGYRRGISRIVFHHVSSCPVECDPRSYAERVAMIHGLDPEESIVFMTGASLPDRVYAAEWGDPQQALIASVGLTPIACAHRVEGSGQGTINIAYITEARLTPHAMVEAVSMISSAKTIAVTHQHLGCGPGAGPSYATATDAIAVLSNPEGAPQEYIGPLTSQGFSLFERVQSLLSKAITSTLRVEERFHHIAGVSIPELVETALAYYDSAPVPGIDRGEVKRLVQRTLEWLLEDPNIWSMLVAARHLDDSGSLGSIPGLSKDEYAYDSKKIVADELLGITLSMYINGWKGLFAYYWIDRTKHNTSTILGGLPMFMDDVLGALVGGILSRVYDRLLGGEV